MIIQELQTLMIFAIACLALTVAPRPDMILLRPRSLVHSRVASLTTLPNLPVILAVLTCSAVPASAWEYARGNPSTSILQHIQLAELFHAHVGKSAFERPKPVGRVAFRFRLVCFRDRKQKPTGYLVEFFARGDGHPKLREFLDGSPSLQLAVLPMGGNADLIAVFDMQTETINTRSDAIQLTSGPMKIWRGATVNDKPVSISVPHESNIYRRLVGAIQQIEGLENVENEVYLELFQSGDEAKKQKTRIGESLFLSLSRDQSKKSAIQFRSNCL